MKVTTETLMMAVLLGGKGALAHRESRRVYLDLCYWFEKTTTDWVAISIVNQDRASQFLYKHGTRAARNYCKSLRRSYNAL